MRKGKRDIIHLEKWLHIRVSEKLYERLCTEALYQNKTVSDIVRMKLMNKFTIPERSMVFDNAGQILKLSNEVRRQGGLLKHTINTINENGKVSAVDMEEIKKAADSYENLALETRQVFKKILQQTD